MSGLGITLLHPVEKEKGCKLKVYQTKINNIDVYLDIHGPSYLQG